MIVRRETRLPVPREEVWRAVSDPERLPAWWPGVSRVEDASPEVWTKVLSSPRGKSVRADYTRLEAEPPSRLVWQQEVEETPFERILAAAVTTISLEPVEDGTRVQIAIDQRPRGWARFAPVQFRAAAKRQVTGAIAGLEGLFGNGEP